MKATLSSSVRVLVIHNLPDWLFRFSGPHTQYAEHYGVHYLISIPLLPVVPFINMD